jgi:dienelactone hydrolase
MVYSILFYWNIQNIFMNLKISEVNMLRFFLLLLLAQIPLMAKIKTEAVEYKDGDIILKGFLAYNTNTNTKLPAVLIVHEWWGLNDYPKMRAEQLAELGYVAFAIDMYGDGKVASSPDEAGKLAGSIRGDIPKLKSACGSLENGCHWLLFRR